MADLLVIGKPENPDKQIVDIVTGRLEYAADNLSGKKLFCRTLGSPHAHAKIVSIDTSAALALKGVEAVTTHEDCPIYSDTLLFWGQEVATVAAVDEHIAAQAIGLIDVQYEVLPHVVDPDEATAPGAPLTGRYPEGNLSTETVTNRGDVEAGMAASDVIIDEVVGWSNNFQHGPLEPRSAVAYWTGDHVYVWTGSQNPFGARRFIAGQLEIPESQVHLISKGTGQGFGDKHSCQWGLVAAILARKAGKPVQNHLSRAENFLHSAHQYPTKLTIKLGMHDDGTILAADAHFLDHGGWRFGHGPIRQTYKIDNGVFKGQAVGTNSPPFGAWRCVWDPQAVFLTDVALDKAAEAVGMNPLDFRMKNIVTQDMMDQDSGKPLASNSIAEVYTKCADAIGYTAKWHQPGTSTLPDGRMHGIGIRAHISSFGSMSSPVRAILNMTRDGKCLINVGTSRAGGGTNTALAHIVAEKLGLNYEDVMVARWGDCDTASDGGGQGGSTRTITLGAAFHEAAQDARDQLFETAAGMLAVTAEELDAAEGKIFVKADPTQFKTHGEVSGRTRGQVVGTGTSWDKNLQRAVGDSPIGTPCEVRTMVGAALEVAVDTETGEVEVLNFVEADDMGRAIFRNGCEGQIQGGMEINFGEAMLYEQILDKTNGATLNTSYIDNKWPTTLDLHTDRHTAIIVESDDACGPYGCKGLGEPPVTCYGVFNLAVYNAIGVWIDTVPIYPQKILKALGKA
jgi:xanthine dehydrogenase molybdenum-binding subunit